MAKAKTPAQAKPKTESKRKITGSASPATKTPARGSKTSPAKKDTGKVNDMETRFYDALISFPDPRQATECERRSALSQIRHIANRFEQVAAANAAAHDMQVSEHYVLAILALSGPEGIAQVADLQRMLGFTSGGVTRCLDRMVTAGLIVRVSCPNDRRAWQAQLTRKGRAIANKLQSTGRPRIREMHTELTREEWKTLDSLLRRINNKMAEIF
jgi:DNA-binding MarR family transcriptional regulator